MLVTANHSTIILTYVSVGVSPQSSGAARRSFMTPLTLVLPTFLLAAAFLLL